MLKFNRRSLFKNLAAMTAALALAVWFVPAAALAQSLNDPGISVSPGSPLTACSCIETASKYPRGCVCGLDACKGICPSGSACSCAATVSAVCQKAKPCAARGEASIAAPTLQIPIPTIELTRADIFAKDSNNSARRVINLPWITQYVTGLYQYLVAIGGFVAAVMLMIGGFQYLTAGGDTGKVSKGKERIIDSVVGLLVILGSYLILRTINPDLTDFAPLTTDQVDQIAFEKMEFIGKDAEQPSGSSTEGGPAVQKEAPPAAGEAVSPTPSPPPPPGASAPPAPQNNLDKIFQAYASCYGLDWRILKAVAKAESGLQSNRVNKQGYQGLFQEKAPYCKTGIGPFTSLFDCTNLLDPEVNTAAAATIMSRALKKIQSACPSATLPQMFLLLYVGHNNGPAVMNYMLKNRACAESEQEKYVRKFYEGKNCTREQALAKKCVDSEYGYQKWKHGNKVVSSVQSSGASVPFPKGARDPSTCPSDTGQRVFPK